jgi:hypothetical protein
MNTRSCLARGLTCYYLGICAMFFSCFPSYVNVHTFTSFLPNFCVRSYENAYSYSIVHVCMYLCGHTLGCIKVVLHVYAKHFGICRCACSVHLHIHDSKDFESHILMFFQKSDELMTPGFTNFSSHSYKEYFWFLEP